MTTFVYRNGELVDKNLASPREVKGQASYVISDEMAETRHMADNRMYTSKAKFRQTTRAHGCVEVGNENLTMLKPRKPIELDRGKRREAIAKSIYQLRNGIR
jgi:hypothetical protein